MGKTDGGNRFCPTYHQSDERNPACLHRLDRLSQFADL